MCVQLYINIANESPYKSQNRQSTIKHGSPSGSQLGQRAVSHSWRLNKQTPQVIKQTFILTFSQSGVSDPASD